jgi:hypothetical protein
MRPLGGFALPRRRCAPADVITAAGGTVAVAGAAAAAAGAAPAGLYPSCFVLTPDGRTIVVGTTAPPLVLVYDAASHAPRHAAALPRGRGGVRALAALPDSRTAVVLCCDGSVSLVDFEAAAAEGELELPGGSSGKGVGSSGSSSVRIRAEAMSVDARGNVLAVITDDGGARVYDIPAARAAMARAAAAGRGGGEGLVTGGAMQVTKLSAGELAALPDALFDGAFAVPVPVGAAAAAATRAASGGGKSLVPVRSGAAGAAGQAEAITAAGAAGSAVAALRPRQLAPNAAAVSRRRLEEVLVTFGEFPSRYRLLIWWAGFGWVVGVGWERAVGVCGPAGSGNRPASLGAHSPSHNANAPSPHTLNYCQGAPPAAAPERSCLQGSGGPRHPPGLCQPPPKDDRPPPPPAAAAGGSSGQGRRGGGGGGRVRARGGGAAAAGCVAAGTLVPPVW